MDHQHIKLQVTDKLPLIKPLKLQEVSVEVELDKAAIPQIHMEQPVQLPTVLLESHLTVLPPHQVMEP